jgi:hypothetical protein
MSAHYAADKHGKSGLRRRNQDASRTLRELSLTYDDEEFDTHLAHDVSILLGDLVRACRGEGPLGCAVVCMRCRTAAVYVHVASSVVERLQQ